MYDIDHSGTEDIVLVNSNAEIHVLHVLSFHLSPVGFLAANGPIPRDFLAPRPFHPPPMVRAPSGPLQPAQLFLARPSASLRAASPRTSRVSPSAADAERLQPRGGHAAAQSPQGEAPPARKTRVHRARPPRSSQCRAFHRRGTARSDAPRVLLSQRARLSRGNPGNRSGKVELRGNWNADISRAASPRSI